MECNSCCYLLFRESSVGTPEVIMFGCLLNHARMVSSACDLMWYQSLCGALKTFIR